LLRPQPTGIAPACGRLDFAVQLPLAAALGRGVFSSVAFSPAWRFARWAMTLY
jgi:hypothetical protein